MEYLPRCIPDEYGKQTLFLAQGEQKSNFSELYKSRRLWEDVSVIA